MAIPRDKPIAKVSSSQGLSASCFNCLYNREPVRIATIGHLTKLVDKVSVWLPNTAVASAVVTVNYASLSHKPHKLPLDDHRDRDNDSQNNDGGGFHKNARNGLTIIQQTNRQYIEPVKSYCQDT